VTQVSIFLVATVAAYILFDTTPWFQPPWLHWTPPALSAASRHL